MWLATSTGFRARRGGSGRAFEKRERRPGEGWAREEVSIFSMRCGPRPLCRGDIIMQADSEHGSDRSGRGVVVPGAVLPRTGEAELYVVTPAASSRDGP